MLKIEGFALRDFNELSRGEQQKVLLARALAQEPGILLLDEPTANLDIRHQLEVLDIVKDLVRKRELSAIIAIHDLNLAAKYADQVVMMNRGQIVAGGNPASVFTRKNLAHVYGVETVVKNDGGELYIMPIRPINLSQGE